MISCDIVSAELETHVWEKEGKLNRLCKTVKYTMESGSVPRRPLLGRVLIVMHTCGGEVRELRHCNRANVSNGK